MVDEQKKILNCPNCCAPLKRDAPYCEYCGTINQSYQQECDVTEISGTSRNLHGEVIWDRLSRFQMDGFDSSLCEQTNQLDTRCLEARDAFTLHEELNCLYKISCVQQAIEEQRQELENRKCEAAVREQMDRLSQKWREAEAASVEVQKVIARNKLVAQDNLTAYVEIPEQKFSAQQRKPVEPFLFAICILSALIIACVTFGSVYVLAKTIPASEAIFSSVAVCTLGCPCIVHSVQIAIAAWKGE